MSASINVKLPVERLREFAARVFNSCGLPEADANLAAGVLVTADLWGIDSHGVARLRAYYEMLARGLVNPRPQLRVVRELPGTAAVDGDNGLGLVIGPQANELAMEKAAAVGAAWVSVCHTNHFGIAGYYTQQALTRDLIGWAMTNTPPLVSQLWGMERMLGTNPISVAVPGGSEPPVIVDMATSAVAYGVVETAVRKHEPLPEGLIIDREGQPTTRAQALDEGGALLPLGRDRVNGGHKGYCLAAMVDLLCGVLSGANWGPFVPPFPHYLRQPERSVGRGLGHLFGAMRIDGFMPLDEFKARVDEWVRVFRAAKPAPGTEGPLIPGDPERAAATLRARAGVPLSAAVVEDLRFVAQQTGVPFD
jgi:L-2-hydroxycarboxylate dehydrogenase (NAD+)